MKIKVRKAKVSDVRQLQEKMYEFYKIIRGKGAKDIAKDDNVLWGGTTIEIGTSFNNPNVHVVVGDKDGEIIAFMVGILEFCPPVAEDMKVVRIHANYLENDSLVGPKILTSMWGLMEDWAKANGAGHYYANIHPGNNASIKVAKSIGFKHHYTQFYRPIELEPEEA